MDLILQVHAIIFTIWLFRTGTMWWCLSPGEKKTAQEICWYKTVRLYWGWVWASAACLQQEMLPVFAILPSVTYKWGGLWKGYTSRVILAIVVVVSCRIFTLKTSPWTSLFGGRFTWALSKWRSLTVMVLVACYTPWGHARPSLESHSEILP